MERKPHCLEAAGHTLSSGGGRLADPIRMPVAAGSLLMLSGVSESVLSQLRSTGVLARIGVDHVFVEHPRLGESLAEAAAAAQRWIDQS